MDCDGVEQVRVTPINAFPVGVTVTPSGGPRLAHPPPGLKIIPSIGLGGIQVR